MSCTANANCLRANWKPMPRTEGTARHRSGSSVESRQKPPTGWPLSSAVSEAPLQRTAIRPPVVKRAPQTQH
jgi:hypothetical protein